MPPFPTSWPLGCPPEDSNTPDIHVYRVVKRNPPDASDFKSQAELKRMLDGDSCLRHGLSVFSDSDEAQQAKKLFPKLGEFIACGYLGNSSDRILFTPTHKFPQSHHTWWTPAIIGRETIFSVSLID